MVMELDRRRAYTDNQIKQALMKMTSEQKIEFLRNSNGLLEHESQIYLNVLSESRQLLNGLLDKLKVDDEESDSSSEQQDLPVDLPFNTGTSMGKKLANMAQMFISNLRSANKTDEITEDAAEKAEAKAVQSYKKATKKHRSSRSKDTEKSTVELETKTKRKKVRSRTRETKKYLETKSYLMKNLQEDLESAAKDEQEIILARMKTQGMQLASEYSRQQTILSEKLEAAKAKRESSQETVQAEAVNQIIDRNQEMTDMYEKDRTEREQALKERLQQRKSKGPDPDDDNVASKEFKRKKKHDLTSANHTSGTAQNESTTDYQVKPTAET